MPKYLISHPDPQFTADLVGLRFTDGTATVDTDTPGGIAAYSYCQRAGYTVNPIEPDAPAADEPEAAAEPNTDGQGDEFDPAAHTADEVIAYLAEADDAERARVLAVEAAELGKQRKTILAFGAPQQGEQS
jgi:hypothetical protein